MSRHDIFAPAKRGLEDVSDIPGPWKHMLTALQVLFPDAVIAGGCLRDRDTGAKVKDIDVFLPVNKSTEEDLQQVKDTLTKDGWRASIITEKLYPQGMDRRVIGVIEADYPGCPPVQIVIGEWRTDRTLLDAFDFGICQIMFDGKTLYRTPDYEADFWAKRFRIVTQRSDEAFVQSINRWARLKEKYPAWHFNLGTRGSGAGPFSAAP